MANETSRLSAAEIFGRVTAGAEEELVRPRHNLAISAVAAGLGMGLSGLGVAVLLALLGDGSGAEAIAFLAYPIGFLVVVIGRQQLFTENTLFPVALVLDQRRMLAATARLWGIVLGANLVGATLFALLATRTPALTEPAQAELVRLGAEAGRHGFADVFWTAVVGGWVIALVAWLVTASTDTVGQVVIVFVLTYLVGIGHFAHSIAGAGEIAAAVLDGDLSLASALTWESAAVLGNATGGVLIVALFNYGQVHRSEQQRADAQEDQPGGGAGRMSISPGAPASPGSCPGSPSPGRPSAPPAPELLALNEPLAADLGLDPEGCGRRRGLGSSWADGARGRASPSPRPTPATSSAASRPRLGDGRALLLGELTDPAGGCATCTSRARAARRSPAAATAWPRSARCCAST